MDALIASPWTVVLLVVTGAVCIAIGFIVAMVWFRPKALYGPGDFHDEKKIFDDEELPSAPEVDVADTRGSYDASHDYGPNMAVITKIERIELEADILSEMEVSDEAVSLDKVQFTTYYPTTLSRRQWYDLLIYIFIDEANERVEKDSKRHLYSAALYSADQTRSSTAIPKGTAIRVVPFMPGCIINPPEATLYWYGDWQRMNFRICSIVKQDIHVTGSVQFYVGPVLIGETSMFSSLTNIPTSIDNYSSESKSTIYESIFVSYSRKDDQIVELIEKVIKALGIDYLRDVNFLRSGDKWNPNVLTHIDKADVFQLCWSKNAKDSQFVEQEWRHALQKGKQRFIRPCYWQKPMADPPDDLSKLHFSYLDLSGYLKS